MEDSTQKYLVFSIAAERYGLPISKVREVIRYEKITTIHDASSYLKGVINLRGKIIPVIDMRAKFGMEEAEYNDRTIFIIVEGTGAKEIYHFGLAVDSVHEVVDIGQSQIEGLPDIGFKLKSDYLVGIAQSENQMLMLLEIDRILSSQDVIVLADESREVNSHLSG